MVIKICKEKTFQTVLKEISENATQKDKVIFEIIDSSHWSEDDAESLLFLKLFFNGEFIFKEINSIIKRKIDEIIFKSELNSIKKN